MSVLFDTWAKTWRWSSRRFRTMAQGWAAVIGDPVVDWAKQALRERMPDVAGDTQSLGLAGAERQLERAPGESNETFGTRLVAWLQLHGQEGSPLGLLLLLDAMGFPDGVLVHVNGLAWQITGVISYGELAVPGAGLPAWVTRTVLPNGNPAIPVSTDGKAAIPLGTVPWWTFAGDQMDAEGNQHTSRFGVLFPSGLPALSDLAQAANLARIRRTIAAWRAGKAKCMGIWVVSAGDLWDWPVDEWENPSDLWDDPAAVVDFYAAE